MTCCQKTTNAYYIIPTDNTLSIAMIRFSIYSRHLIFNFFPPQYGMSIVEELRAIYGTPSVPIRTNCVKKKKKNEINGNNIN